jgi:hypothetical protein
LILKVYDGSGEVEEGQPQCPHYMHYFVELLMEFTRFLGMEEHLRHFLQSKDTCNDEIFA